MTKKIDDLFWWMLERHSIYLKKSMGEDPPWTDDEIMQKYKFTNVFRELDRVTVWMRKNMMGEWSTEPASEIILNACIFRRTGTPELMTAFGWFHEWDKQDFIDIIDYRLKNKEITFTGAYNIPNAGRSEAKSIVVADHLQGVVDNLWKIVKVAEQENTLEAVHNELHKLDGWGGSGFMAYEVVSDLRWTHVLRDATDILTWANSGVGAIRGLNRVWGRPTKKALKSEKALEEMRYLFDVIAPIWLETYPDYPLEMREIEHSLCEFDKYQRTANGEGRPRSRYHYDKQI